MVQNASAAIDFYAQALGAAEVMRIAAPDGRVLHAETAIEGSVLMLGDATYVAQRKGNQRAKVGIAYINTVLDEAARARSAAGRAR